MTAMWLLPVVTLIVAASSGGVLGRALLNISPYFALITIVVAAFLVTTGLSLALMILTIYLFRLVVYGLPQGGSILSVFLPLGPTGQSGYAILLIGQTLKNLLPYNPASQFLHSKVTGEVTEVVCICAAFLLWSLATMWMLYALLALQASLRQNRVPFKLSFWGLVFPNVRICVFSRPWLALSCMPLSAGCLRQPHHSARHHIWLKCLPCVGINLCSWHFYPLGVNRFSLVMGVEMGCLKHLG